LSQSGQVWVDRRPAALQNGSAKVASSTTDSFSGDDGASPRLLNKTPKTTLIKPNYYSIGGFGRLVFVYNNIKAELVLE